MRTIFTKIHLWLSIPFGLIVSIICLSGAALVFEKDIMEVIRHDLYHVAKVEPQAMPLKQLMSAVAITLPDSVTITGVSIPSSPEKAYQVTLSKPRRTSIYIDQYSAQIKGRNERAAFFTFMFRTHRWLLDSANPNGGIFWGKMVVGISTIMFIIVLISGIIIWIPRTRRALKNRLKVTTDKGIRRLFYDLHVAGGVYAATILLLLAVTGLTWSFSWYRTGFYKLFGVETTVSGHGTATSGSGTKAATDTSSSAAISSPSPSAIPASSSDMPDASTHKGRPNRSNVHNKNNSSDQNIITRTVNKYTVWSKVQATLMEANPDFKIITISDTKAAVMGSNFGNQRAADSYEFDSQSGEITKMTKYRDAAKSTKIRGWIYSVHVGDWGGWFSKTITLLAALMGALMPLTGYYLWIKRCRRKRCRFGNQ